MSVAGLLDAIGPKAERTYQTTNLIEGKCCVKRFSEHPLLMRVSAWRIRDDKLLKLLLGFRAQQISKK